MFGHRSLRGLVATLCLSLALPACGTLRRNTGVGDMSSQVTVNSTERDIATLERGQYEVLAPVEGSAYGRRVFILWFPVGAQETRQELEANAAFNAVAKRQGCDELMFPHTKSTRILIPLLLVNVAISRVRLKGRCVRMLHNAELGIGVEVEADSVDDPTAAPSTAPAEPVVAPAEDDGRTPDPFSGEAN